jgi:hypothetical protein
MSAVGIGWVGDGAVLANAFADGVITLLDAVDVAGWPRTKLRGRSW